MVVNPPAKLLLKPRLKINLSDNGRPQVPQPRGPRGGRTLLNRYNFIGRRIEDGVVDADDVLRTEWQPVIRLHQQLGPFIEAETARLAARARQFGETPYPQATGEPFRRQFTAELAPTE
ncbi:hypothetical protein [Nonomuraea roseola]|uniref:Uncharacterized protein n=1 Tax=Nonomuraea roseola TaxID=46179 RepID=A0ABV5QB22_9ACTN